MAKQVINPLYIVKDTYICRDLTEFNKAFAGWQTKFGGCAVRDRLMAESFTVLPDVYPCVVRFSVLESGDYHYQIAEPWQFREGGVAVPVRSTRGQLTDIEALAGQLMAERK